jgi:hypothetical protein
MTEKLNLYYENLLAGSNGGGEVIESEAFDELVRNTEQVITDINKTRNDGLTPFRDLPYIQDNLEIVEDIKERYSLDGGLVIIASSSICESIEALTFSCAAQGDIEKAPLSIWQYDDNSDIADHFKNSHMNLDEAVFLAVNSPEDPDYVSGIINHLSESSLISQRLITAGLDQNSPVGDYCTKHNILNIDMPPGINGRCNIFSAPVLLFASLKGIDAEQLLAGARAADLQCSNEEFDRNPAAVFAALTNWFCRNCSSENTLVPHIDSLDALCLWACSLWNECAGVIEENEPSEKQIGEKQLRTYIGQTCDPHGVPNTESPFMDIKLSEVNDYTMGMLIYMFETATVIYSKYREMFGGEGPEAVLRFAKAEFIGNELLKNCRG